MRVFQRRPKWVAYLFLLLILSQLAYQFLRYHFGSDEWKEFSSTDYGYALSYPGNWTLEEYSGRYKNRDDVVALISDFIGLYPANNLLMVFWRRSDDPSLANTADWGRAVIIQENGSNISSLEEVVVGPNKLPALKQSFHYADNYDGMAIYITSRNAECIFLFSNKENDDVTREVIRRIVASIKLAE